MSDIAYTPRRSINTYAYIGVTLLITLAGILEVSARGRVFPYVDDWWYVSPFTRGWGWDLWTYMFQLHNDHRIPIQKLIHAVVLWCTGYDFRALVALNFLVAGSASVFLILAVKNHRGYSSLGDLIIPALLCIFGASWTFIGFNFQFLSCIFCACLFLYFISLYELRGQQAYMAAALWVMFACSWCGMNGVVISLVCITGVGFHIYCNRRNFGMPVYVAWGMAIASCIIVIALWKPSPVSDQQATLRQFLLFSWEMSSGSLSAWASPHRALKWIAIALLCAGGLSIYVHKRVYRSPFGMAVGTVWLASFVLIAAVAKGRAGSANWDQGYDGHYGYLTVLIPVLSWIALSTSQRATRSTALFVAAFFGAAAIYNYVWRVDLAKYQAPMFAVVQQAIASRVPSRQIVDDNFDSFYTNDNREALKKHLGDLIDLLRSHGGKWYGRQ